MNEEISTLSPGSAGSDPAQQAADPGAQAPAQGQSGEPGAVDPGLSQASSNSGQPRSNFNWANQRLIEKAINKVLSSTLDERLKPIMDRLPQAQPAGPEASRAEIDYNDLAGSIKRLVEDAIKQKESTFNKTLPQLKNELLSDISTQTSRQEARKFLQSQKDIGMDASKYEEIQEIIANDKILYNSIADYPQEVVKQAVERWRTSKRNPNAPGKDELSTVAGGMGAARRGGLDMNRLKSVSDSVDKVLTPDEREKLNADISRLVASMK